MHVIHKESKIILVDNDKEVAVMTPEDAIQISQDLLDMAGRAIEIDA